MSADRDVTRIVRSWLHEDGSEDAERVLFAVIDQLDTTPQRRPFGLARRRLTMNPYLRIGVVAATLLVAAVIGIQVFSGGPNVTNPGPTATPSPSLAPSPSPTPPGWPPAEAALEVGRHDLGFQGVPFSLRIPSDGWFSSQHEAVLEKGTFPSADFVSIAFLQTYDSVADDPCAATTIQAGPSVSDMAEALTTIPGTEADAPIDVTVGGRPAKLVVFTISEPFGCPRDSFWLFGTNSAYPATRHSTFRIWVFELDGTRYLIISDQARPNPEIGPDVTEVVESIQFE